MEQNIIDPSGTHCFDEVCLAVFWGTGLATLVVSGSIVIVGNVMHWLEKQGRCSDEYLDEKVIEFKEEYIDNQTRKDEKE